MKIIKKGTKTLPEAIVYVKKCEFCGCKFTYTTKDIDFTIFPDYHQFLECPQCKYRVVVPSIKRKYKGDVKNENND